jgi:hypothetical protein
LSFQRRQIVFHLVLVDMTLKSTLKTSVQVWIRARSAQRQSVIGKRLVPTLPLC